MTARHSNFCMNVDECHFMLWLHMMSCNEVSNRSSNAKNSTHLDNSKFGRISRANTGQAGMQSLQWVQPSSSTTASRLISERTFTGHNAMHAAQPKQRSSSTMNVWFNCRAMILGGWGGSSYLRWKEMISHGRWSRSRNAPPSKFHGSSSSRFERMLMLILIPEERELSVFREYFTLLA